MTDLLAAVITLEAQAAGELDYFQGRAMHALFLELTGPAEPARAQALHDSDDLKPFMSSNLIGLRGPEGSQRAGVQPGAAFRWRVTAFEPGLAGLWLTQVLPELPETITVGDVPCAVRGWTTDGAQDGMAGVGGYAELAMQHTLQGVLSIMCGRGTALRLPAGRPQGNRPYKLRGYVAGAVAESVDQSAVYASQPVTYFGLPIGL